MIEIALLNAVIAKRDLSALVRSGLLDDHAWHEQRCALQFIRKHVSQYGEMPAVESVITACPDFEHVDVHESVDTLVAKLHERNLKLAQRRLLEKAAEKFGEADGYQLLDLLSGEMEKIRQQVATRGEHSVVNWAKDADKRRQEYERRKSQEYQQTIPILFDAVTDAVGGAARGEYINFLAFTGVGKSWLACLQALVANKAGYKVLIESGEMGHHEIETRLDTLEGGFSNYGLWTGTLDAPAEQNYMNFLERQEAQNRPDVIIRGPEDWPMGLTLEQIRSDIRRFRPDVIIIDQFNLCRFAGHDHQSKAEFSRQLKLMFAAEGVVGFVLNQASGDYGKRQNGQQEDEDENAIRELRPPRKSDYSESIATIQDANKVISLDAVKWRDEATGRDRGKALLSIEKSRSGGEGTLLELHWMPGDGVIRPRERTDIF